MAYLSKPGLSKVSKIIAFLIIMTFMLSMFLACGDNAGTDSDSNNDSALGDNNQPAGENDDGEEATEEPKIEPDLEDADFGGHVFTIISRYRESPDWIDWNVRDVYAEEQTGEPINDAVYQRNTMIEDKYNFKIESSYRLDNDPVSDVRRAVNAGDDVYDAAMLPMRDVPSQALNGMFLDLKDVPNIDLEKPWWDQAANSALSFGNRLFYTSGDLMLVNNFTCTAILFNKDLHRDLGLDDPYSIVKSGKWTIDALYNMCKDASEDINGDGIMDFQDDRFGFIGQRDTLISFLHSSNEYIAKKDSQDYPFVTFGSERSYAAMEGCFKIMYDRNITHNAHHLESRGYTDRIYPISEEMFMGNRALFMWVRLVIVQNLRSMDTDFGILPLPKLNEAQDDYYTDVISYTGNLLCIPATAGDPARTGHILEAICAESKYTTQPAYYEVTLKTKMARDDESEEMLDIIFNNRIWDIGEFSNYGDFGWQLISLSMKDDPNVASLFEKRLPTMERDIAKAIENFEKLF